MSWPEARTWHVGLAAQRLFVARAGALWPGKLADCESIDYAPVAGADPWRAAVSALARLLAEKAGARPTLRIVLSGSFVRWQLLPWQPELTRPEELAAYARLRFRETFGNTATHWRVLHSSQPPGKTLPACAVDAALMDTLHATCAAAGARLAAVTPYFASAFDRWRKVWGGKTAWFGLIEPDCISLGLLRGGDWIGLRSERFDRDWREVLPGMMAQIGLPASLGDGAVPLYLAGSGAQAPTPAAGLPFAWLQPPTRSGSVMAGCRMALGV